MTQVETADGLGAEALAEVQALVARTAPLDDGEDGIDAHRLAQVAAGRSESGEPVVATLVREGGTLVAYAQAVHTHRRWEVELLVGGEARDRLVEAGTAALAPVLGGIAGAGGGPVHLWAHHATGAHGDLAEAVGLKWSRDLWQMRRPLPVAEPFAIETRPFVVGQDEEAWVRVNNRAFAWHPEQSGWTVDELVRHESEDWFDPEGFLVHEWHGRMAGFCWTKVHARHDPPLGEIYVVAVDPQAAGLGLGRKLTLAGLDHMARRGIEVGMLYVDATNEPAVRLYERLGFTVHHVDRAYTGDVSPR
jgi:mycothiol synthase